MNNNIETISIKEYLTNQGIKFKEIGSELVARCPFCEKDQHIYFNKENSQYHCKRCGETGNIFTLSKHLQGDSRDIVVKEKKLVKKTSPVKYPDIGLIDQCFEKMTPEIRQYLLDRGITEGQIRAKRLGYGHFYGKWWITMPIFDQAGKFVFFKLRQDPFDTSHKDKGKVWPSGSKVEIYGWEELLREDKNMLVVCEGELDRLVLENQGIPAITSTAGAGTFKDEWLPHLVKFQNIYVCFDNDEAGRLGASKLLDKLDNLKKVKKSKLSHSSNARLDFRLFNIVLPITLGVGGDVTDYFTKFKGNVDDFMALAKEVKPVEDEVVTTKEIKRIIEVKPPDKLIEFADWQKVIKTNFPDLLFSAEIGISIMAQILIKDITNPFALVFIDVPSSGKTICINFFSEIEGLTYATDKFSPASFVSNAANISKDRLGDIDMLPRIRYKMFLLRDLATLFSKRDDDLSELMGTLTRVLDGEGLNTDSGVHGGRKYVGEYLFMLLAGSTPIAPKVWKIMGNLGSRLFFLNLNSRERSQSEMIDQLTTSTYKVKEDECRTITKDFLYTLWHKYPDGVAWDFKPDTEMLEVVVRCGVLLSHLRGTINNWRDSSNDDGFEGSHISTNIEKPYRINQLFYNLCRGHALTCGRRSINHDDLRLVVEVAIDSAPPVRGRLFRRLIDNGGQLNTLEIENFLGCSKPTALKEMEVLKILGVCYFSLNKLGSAGNPERTIQLCAEFSWFLSDECKRLRNVPIDPKQTTMSDSVYF
ncbi:MAG: toprim domain-containing protein [bacterium]